MFNVTTHKAAMTLKTQNNETLRFEYKDGGLHLATNMEKQNKAMLTLGANIKRFLKNFADKKRDYAQRMAACADILNPLASTHKNLTLINKKFEQELGAE